MTDQIIYHTSEWVSPGHPDKVADCISEYLLDEFISKDPNTRYAVECQIKDNIITLAGELTSKYKMTETAMYMAVREALNLIGYTPEYQKRFGKNNTISSQDFIVNSHISEQSPDIAQGVNKDAWGDQGIFFGYFCRETQSGHGADYAIAKKLGQCLYRDALTGKQPIGIDIKTQVTICSAPTGEFEVTDVVVAIPTIPGTKKEKVRTYVKKVIKEELPWAVDANLIINGTGAYHIHGPIGDSGTTGRKLVVDFYGSRSRIGGGSPWTKDPSKADLTLNLFAYDMARHYFLELKEQINKLHHVETELACCIGKQDVSCFITAYDEDGVPVYRTMESGKVTPSELIKKYQLDKPNYFRMCRDGLFTYIN